MSALTTSGPQATDPADSMEVKVVLVGSRSVGKTKVLSSYASRHREGKYIGSEFYQVLPHPSETEKRIALTLNDVGEGKSEIDSESIRDANIILYCFAVNDKSTYDDILNRWKNLCSKCDWASGIIVATKIDLQNTPEGAWYNEFKANELKDKMGALEVARVSMSDEASIDSLVRLSINQSYAIRGFGFESDTTIMLNVRVMEASGLLGGDVFSNNSDPYVKVKVKHNGETQAKGKTAVQKSSVEPVWTEQFSFGVNGDVIRNGTLVFEIWDYDRFTRDDPLGTVTLSLKDFYKKGETISYNIMPPKWSRVKYAGLLKLHIEAFKYPMVLSRPVTLYGKAKLNNEGTWEFKGR